MNAAPVLVIIALLVIVPSEQFGDFIRMSGNAISSLSIVCGHVLGCLGSGFVLSLAPLWIWLRTGKDFGIRWYLADLALSVLAAVALAVLFRWDIPDYPLY